MQFKGTLYLMMIGVPLLVKIKVNSIPKNVVVVHNIDFIFVETKDKLHVKITTGLV